MEYFCGSYAPFCLDPINVVCNGNTIRYPRINGGIHYRDCQEERLQFVHESDYLDYISKLINIPVNYSSQIACNENNIVLLMDNAYTLRLMELVEINLSLLYIVVRHQRQTQDESFNTYGDKYNCKPYSEKEMEIDNDGKKKIKCYFRGPNDESEDENDDKMAMEIQYLLTQKKVMQRKEKSDNPQYFHTIRIQSSAFTRIDGRRTVHHIQSNRYPSYNEFVAHGDRNISQFPEISDSSVPTNVNNTIRVIEDNKTSYGDNCQNMENIERNFKNSRHTNFLHEDDRFPQVIEVSGNAETSVEQTSSCVSYSMSRISNTFHDIDSWTFADFSDDAKRCLMNGARRYIETEDMSSVEMYTMLCIDTSESMGTHGINGMKEFVRNFVKGIREASNRHKVSEALAVTVFGKYTSLIKGWTTNCESVIEECESLQPCGPSPLALGIYISIAALTNAGITRDCYIRGDNPNIMRRIILISDGRPTRRTCDPFQHGNDDSCVGDEMDVRLEIADQCVPCLQAKHIPVLSVPTREIDESEKRFLRRFSEHTNGQFFESIPVASRNLARSLSVKVHTEKLYHRYRSRGLSWEEIEDSMTMSCTGDDEYLDSLRNSLNRRIEREDSE